MARTLNISRFLKLFIVTICACALLYGYVFYTISTGAAFTAFRGWCARSQSVVAIAGQFQKTELLPFVSFFEKDKGETGLAGFTARIVGSTKTIDVEVTMKRAGDKWDVDRVLASGKMLDTK